MHIEGTTADVGMMVSAATAITIATHVTIAIASMCFVEYIVTCAVRTAECSNSGDIIAAAICMATAVIIAGAAPDTERPDAAELAASCVVGRTGSLLLCNSHGSVKPKRLPEGMKINQNTTVMG